MGEVDILFANEAEICSLYETDDFAQAAAAVRGHVAIAALTRSAHGSVVLGQGRGDEAHDVAAAPVDRVVDTTGAGDLYAAGFLYGLTRGLPLPDLRRARQPVRRRDHQPCRRPARSRAARAGRRPPGMSEPAIGSASGWTSTPIRSPPISDRMQQLDLTDNERAALITALRRLVEPQPLSPQSLALKAILDRLEPHKPRSLPEDASTG